MQFMSWSLNEPSNAQFLEFAKEDAPGEWTIINRDAYLDWPGDQRNFWTAFQQHNEKKSLHLVYMILVCAKMVRFITIKQEHHILF